MRGDVPNTYWHLSSLMGDTTRLVYWLILKTFSLNDDTGDVTGHHFSTCSHMITSSQQMFTVYDHISLADVHWMTASSQQMFTLYDHINLAGVHTARSHHPSRCSHWIITSPQQMFILDYHITPGHFPIGWSHHLSRCLCWTIISADVYTGWSDQQDKAIDLQK